MIGIIGKINIKYTVGSNEYEEIVEVKNENTYYLQGCNRCKLVIDEVYYVEDTVYGVNVYFNDNEDDSFVVFGNESVNFEIKEFDIVGTMKITMF